MLNDDAVRPIPIAAWVGTPQTISLSVTSANVQLRPYSHYRVWSSVAAFFQLGPDNTVIATTSSHPTAQGLDILIATDGTNVWLAGVVGTGTGTMYLSRLDARSV